MRSIRLSNGKQMPFWDYGYSGLLIVKFIDTDYDTVKAFFGDDIITSFQFLDENNNVIFLQDTPELYLSSVSVSQELVEKTIQILVAEGSTESKEPVYKDTVVKEEEPVVCACLESPSIEKQLKQIKNRIKIVNPSTLDLNGWKEYKQEENKRLLREFFDVSYIDFNGKKYGVTEEDQTEMALNYTQYQISKQINENAVLEWHAKKEKCVDFTEEDFLALMMSIKSFVYPRMNTMQGYKEAIYACASIDEVAAIEIKYDQS